MTLDEIGAFYRLVEFSQILKNDQGLTPQVLSLLLKDLQNDDMTERRRHISVEIQLLSTKPLARF